MEEIKRYLTDVEVTNFIAMLREDERIQSIAQKYREKVLRRGRRYNKYNEYFLVNIMLHAIKKGHYNLKINKMKRCDVVMTKIRKGGAESFVKNIKTFVYDRYDLIAFLSIITLEKKNVSDFFEIPDVRFIIKQLSIFGIENIVELCS